MSDQKAFDLRIIKIKVLVASDEMDLAYFNSSIFSYSPLHLPHGVSIRR